MVESVIRSSGLQKKAAICNSAVPWEKRVGVLVPVGSSGRQPGPHQAECDFLQMNKSLNHSFLNEQGSWLKRGRRAPHPAEQRSTAGAVSWVPAAWQPHTTDTGVWSGSCRSSSVWAHVKRSKPARCREQTQNPERSGRQKQSPYTETAPPGGGPPESGPPVNEESTTFSSHSPSSFLIFTCSFCLPLGLSSVHLKYVHVDIRNRLSNTYLTCLSSWFLPIMTQC